ncbi:NAD-dependent epimerase/dehydratase family protein [Nocardiopsis sp. EMB25]|uniref:NAD-dependent epimerase/dehydratase family protein n=1 Tax=Nocardiopsis sp. EMB25 TaxID=2835867 RepID=UPI002284E424|nr:NAD-dependent epimerase/dehydratase family protein [Nocardiopsis sp. EMB25]MCY9782845.1 NAD-dependent epimerase/dehydratase family protein [Nocardiopsis sp. EMB25]
MGHHVIVGAGQIGAPLASALHRRGHRVTLVSRSGRGPQEVERIASDASDQARLTTIVNGADVLYNCANPPYHRWPEDWPPLAAALLGAAQDTGADYVLLGNLYVYAPPKGPMRESDPLDPPGAKALARARMWRDALATSEAGRFRVTEIRCGDYYGPGCVSQSHLGERFVPRLLRGRAASFLYDADQPHTWSYVGDVVEALIMAGTDERSFGRAWHVPSNPPVSARHMAEEIGRIAGLDTVNVSVMPRWLVRALGVASPTLREMEEVRYQFTRPFVVDSTDFQETFGLAPTPLETTLKETVEWWREHLNT